MPTVKELLRRVPLGLDLLHADTAAEARRYLQDAGAGRPCLVLLDLDHLQRDGLELLGEIKQQPNSCSIPTVVLASTSDPQNVDKAFGLGAAGYIVKPEGIEGLAEMVTAINEYWTLSELPAPAGR